MSIDLSVQLYFPASGAVCALEATQQILRRHKTKEGIEVVTPGGKAVGLAAYPDSDRGDREMTFVLERGSEIGGLVAGVPCLAGTRPRGPIHPQLGRAGGELVRRGDRTYAVIPVDLALARDDEYMEISFSTSISPVVSAFQSRPFRSRLSRVLAEGGGVAAVYFGMGEWSSFADPDQGLDVPDVCDPEAAGIDAFVSFLFERLA